MRDSIDRPPDVHAFTKYRSRGAYHWDALRRHPRWHDCFTAARYTAVLDAAELRPTDRVLDVGSGDGALAWLARAQVPEGTVVGVEPDAVGRTLAEREFARRNARCEFLADIADAPEGAFDVVICAEVIEHVPDGDRLLTEIKRVLRPGGRVALSTPIRTTERPLDREHVQEFYPDQFATLVGKHFSVTRHDRLCPAFAVDLYFWRPWFFLRRGVIRWAMNILSAWFGVQLIRGLSPTGRYHLVQVVVGMKP